MPTQLTHEQREAAITCLIEHSPEEILHNVYNRSDGDAWTAQRITSGLAYGQ
jgi:hypothetical protein